MSVKWTLLVLKFIMLTARWHHSLPPLSWTHFSSFLFPTPSSYFILQKTTITKALFLKISNCWVALSSAEHPYRVISVCDPDKLSLWALWACFPGFWSERLVAYPGFFTSLVFWVCFFWRKSIEIVYEVVWVIIIIIDIITDVPQFAPLCPPPHLWPSPRWRLCPWVMHICSLANLFTFHPVPPLPPLWPLSIRSVHPCLWFCFVHEFIRFYI